MPVGGKGKPAGGYRAGKKGSYGCKGYPTVSADGTVHGCHPTKAKAQSQARAIWASVARKFVPSVEKAMVSEGDFVAFICHDEEMKIGRVEHVMTEGLFGLTGSEYAMEGTPEDPVLSIRIYEEEDGAWEETEYTVGHRASEVVKVESIKVYQEMVVEMTATPNGMIESEVPAEDMMDKVQTANAPYQDYNSEMQMEEEDAAIEEQRRRMIEEELGKAKDPNYGEMIKPRRGGSDPANPRLYARIVQEAKDKFDVYPSAVANGWVVQEYKRRGGTYKGEDMSTSKTMWGGSIFDLNPFAKRDYTVPQRRRMAANGEAMPDGSYPIGNKQDLMNAIRSWGRGGSDPKVKAFIMRRARALGAEDMIPENWK